MSFCLAVALIVAALVWLFAEALHPDHVVFSNDGPLGALQSQQSQTFGPIWADLNWLGRSEPAWSASGITGGFRALMLCRNLAIGTVLLCMIGWPLAYWWTGRGVLKGIEIGLLACWCQLIGFGLVLALLHFLTGNPEYLGASFGLLSFAFMVGFGFLPPAPDPH